MQAAGGYIAVGTGETSVQDVACIHAHVDDEGSLRVAARASFEFVAQDEAVESRGRDQFEVPERIETMAAEPIAMPRAPLHTLRLLAVRPAAGTGLLPLPSRNG